MEERGCHMRNAHQMTADVYARGVKPNFNPNMTFHNYFYET